ncbi:hypothetical protein Taro_006599 [Colocasia esculenta]|uniref:Uncharacterized protein n=1 Tax=Colocasia esculenta TaxID=4460 RepID=A0A843TXV3_COLES|nr:hypothetical protein [Colocasia esculenta]
MVHRPVVLRLLTRRGGPSRSRCQGLKAQAGYPFPLSLLLPFSLSLRRPLPPLFSPLCVSGEEEGRLWCRGIVDLAWSEEEVANRREGPHWGSFFVKGRDFLCPSRSGWIGSPSGFIDSFTAFPMLPSPLCCVWMVCGRPRIEDPVGLPPCWCRDGSARHEIRGGIGPLGHDLIATRLAVVIRLSRRASRSRQDCCRGVFLPGRNRVVVVPFPVVMPFPIAMPAVRRGFVMLPHLFARCLALEGLSRSEVVSVSWDPHPQEPVEGGIRATSVLELAAHVWDAEGFGVHSWRRPDSPLSHCLSLRWFQSHVVVLGMRPQLGHAAVLRVLCVSVAALSRPCAAAEAGARLASRACGLRVPLLAASGGGLVAVVVTVFSSRCFRVFLVALACTAVLAWLCLAPVGVVGLALGRPVLLVIPASVFSQFHGPIPGCAEHCFRFVPDSIGFCGSRGCATTLFLLLWPVRDWLQSLLCRVRGECGRSACSCRNGAVGAGLADSGLPCVEDACEPVQVRCSWSSSAHLSVCASRRLREPECGVAFTGAGFEVLLEFFSVGSGRSEDYFAFVSAVALAGAFWFFPGSPFVASGGGSSQECFVFVSGNRCVAPVIRSVPFGWAAF